ncbi:putative protein [Arabidopsis thaliana]|uniref:Putative cytosolic sulfotransferase 2 n=4 Tax=Arabidopsis TaxID=3701 RepID=SOT2_ARATH|nr:P-loop containing nucleoside triphosphate hydrolases superfamily protein [Arabidopsis thaliana]Q9SD25.1 PUTATIVE PSEUDOGENE: RecName: Full=Putative cytosolic sulfotransferase 2; Short=AtSOT2 [Arabidopsis thaliana]KAG7634007.1 P-loop containing nucleoside triphosphate hydrolase [Arabidopsis suecica]AEE78763.1 P-loop containing nucleoside triphosphate hydrolases superfamily protein [Arabidopsis thaliana]CAB62643.1 putative protein [Arabidopsis thaliana]VYS60045.1 unnamed protein product [Arab|eukprot:NP_190689.1 P-loop containing nucleoside triphosphate hydrolases superfamily protein [Arabidopsis thaliana]
MFFALCVALSGREVNKTRRTVNGVDHKDFFRDGKVGDWKNHLSVTLETENKIDMTIKEKFQGSGTQD